MLYDEDDPAGCQQLLDISTDAFGPVGAEFVHALLLHYNFKATYVAEVGRCSEGRWRVLNSHGPCAPPVGADLSFFMDRWRRPAALDGERRLVALGEGGQAWLGEVSKLHGGRISLQGELEGRARRGWLKIVPMLPTICMPARAQAPTQTARPSADNSSLAAMIDAVAAAAIPGVQVGMTGQEGSPEPAAELGDTTGMAAVQLTVTPTVGETAAASEAAAAMGMAGKSSMSVGAGATVIATGEDVVHNVGEDEEAAVAHAVVITTSACATPSIGHPTTAGITPTVMDLDPASRKRKGPDDSPDGDHRDVQPHGEHGAVDPTSVGTVGVHRSRGGLAETCHMQLEGVEGDQPEGMHGDRVGREHQPQVTGDSEAGSAARHGP